jgi:hypothetical protein
MLLVVAPFVIGAASCSVSTGSDMVSPSKLEGAITDELRKMNAEAIDDVVISCPEAVEAAKGETTTCTLTAKSSSNEYDVAITMTDDEGSFDLKVADDPN